MDGVDEMDKSGRGIKSNWWDSWGMVEEYKRALENSAEMRARMNRFYEWERDWQDARGAADKTRWRYGEDARNLVIVDGEWTGIVNCNGDQMKNLLVETLTGERPIRVIDAREMLPFNDERYYWWMEMEGTKVT